MVKGTPVCCKSTATPEFYYDVSQKYKNIKIVHSPEYLNKTNPIKMFQGQKFFIIGGDEHAAMTVGHIFKSRLNHVKKLDILIFELLQWLSIQRMLFLHESNFL